MKRFAQLPTRRAAQALGWVLAAYGCVGPEDPETRCPQTGEFGNGGCAEIAGRLFGPDGQLAVQDAKLATVLTVRARSVHSLGGVEAATTPDSGHYRLRLTRHGISGVGLPDTTSVWLVGLLLDNRNIQVGQPLPVLAVDSVLRPITIAPVGERFRRDTVDLHLRLRQASAPR